MNIMSMMRIVPDATSSLSAGTMSLFILFPGNSMMMYSTGPSPIPYLPIQADPRAQAACVFSDAGVDDHPSRMRQQQRTHSRPVIHAQPAVAASAVDVLWPPPANRHAAYFSCR